MPALDPSVSTQPAGEPPAPPTTRTKVRVPRGARAIEAYDARGNVVARYPSLATAAAVAGYVANAIQKAITSGSWYHGLHWRYATAAVLQMPAVILTPEPQTNSHRVESYDLQTGRTIKQYPSQKAVYADGFRPKRVGDVLYGRQKTYKNLGWRYTVATSKTPPPTTTEADSPAVARTLLAEAHRRNEIAQLNRDVYYVPSQNKWAIRLSDGRCLSRPTRTEAIDLWYAEHADQAQTEEKPAEAAGNKAPRRKYERYANTPGHIEALDPRTGAVAFVFRTVGEAGRHGFTLSSVYQALQGVRPEYRKLRWRHVPSSAVAPPETNACCASSVNAPCNS